MARPVAYAHRQRSVALRAWRVEVFSQFRWLTHTGREVPPSGLKPNSRIFCKIHYRAGYLREIYYARV